MEDSVSPREIALRHQHFTVPSDGQRLRAVPVIEQLSPVSHGAA